MKFADILQPLLHEGATIGRESVPHVTYDLDAAEKQLRIWKMDAETDELTPHAFTADEIVSLDWIVVRPGFVQSAPTMERVVGDKANRPIPAAPLYSIGKTVQYTDREGRSQVGKVQSVKASWKFTKVDGEPHVSYDLEHPTYRNGTFHTRQSDIIGPLPKYRNE